ncbi:MAG: acetyl-CoA C-acyltransferase [Alphaproteobacteria bacterium]|nr:acetyl-CoA C-acyltransferase [Alphaproteobacteria bacterium]
MTERAPVITGYARTPIGGFQGILKDFTAPELGADAIRAALSRSGIAPEKVDDVYMGCVLSAGLGQAPARQAAIMAGLSPSVPCTTVSKVCGSGMKALMVASDAVQAGSIEVAVAGGMESMTRTPYLLPKMRAGQRMGHGQALDHMFFDGLEDAYEKGRLMGSFAEECVREHGFTREDQDAFALTSLRRALIANQDGSFEAEITPVAISKKDDVAMLRMDEQPEKADKTRIPLLKPAFVSNGTITAANASSISDGAAALVVMSWEAAEAQGVEVLGTVRGYVSHAQSPATFATAPIGAIQKLCDRVGWNIREVDLFEINEAFAVVTMAAMKHFGLSHEKVNVHGGACALGHPIGASGARIVVTLLAAMKKYNLKRGIASLCIGGGEATAIAVER